MSVPAGRRLAGLAVAALLITSGCSSMSHDGFANGGVACLGPAAPGSEADLSIPALVDRSDVIALVNVLKVEPTRTAGNYDDQGARRVTLRTVQAAKGAAPAEFPVLDGPCPMLLARQGEALVVFLEPVPGGAGLKPIGFPVAALRATEGRPLAQLMTEIGAVRPLDGEARSLFERYGWTVTATRGVAELDVPRRSEFGLAGGQLRGAAAELREPFERYALLSDDVGLDLRAHAGGRAELLTFWLEHQPPEFTAGTAFGQVLIADRRLVGAWVNVFPERGVFSVRDRARALAAPDVRPSYPPANRAMGEINIAKTYDLPATRSIAFKTGVGGNGELTDPQRIRAFVDALDQTLPTKQAVREPLTGPTAYFLHFVSGSRTVSVEYDARSGTLAVTADGFSVEPGQRFAALIVELR